MQYGLIVDVLDNMELWMYNSDNHNQLNPFFIMYTSYIKMSVRVRECEHCCWMDRWIEGKNVTIKEMMEESSG